MHNQENECIPVGVSYNNTLLESSPKLVKSTKTDTDDYEKALCHIQQLNENYNNILVRIVSVSDNVVREQLKEEHDMIHDMIQHADNELTQIRFKYMAYEHKKQYLCLITPTDFANSLYDIYNNVVDIGKMSKINRVRQPCSLNDRRKLIIFCRVLNAVILVKDIEGIVIDYIGDIKKMNISNNNPVVYVVYVNFFSLFSDYDRYSTTCQTIQSMSICQSYR
jgi:hypothetical protein